MQSPEPDYRRLLRETDAKMKAVAGRMQLLHISLEGVAVEGAIGLEWQPLEGVAGCETRLIAGAFVMEARYLPGTVHRDISVNEAVYGQVKEGRFCLKRHGVDTELVTYEAGQLFHLAPGQPHAWQVDVPTTNLVVFVPNS